MGNQMSSQKASLVALLVVAYVAVAAKAASLVMVDAGSSGSKLFSYGPNGKEKVLTNCDEASVKQGKTLKGLSAYLYAAKKECTLENKHQTSEGVFEKYDPNPDTPAGYKDLLLKRLKVLNHNPENKKKIPMMATAGMRLLSQEENHQVWEDVCGEDHDGFQFAPADGGFCGTIPGTREAYFEWGAMVANTGNPNVGAFTIGGASAQISIPIFDEDTLAKFRAMKARIKTAFNGCKEVYLPKVCEDEERKKCEPRKKMGWFNMEFPKGPDGKPMKDKKKVRGDCHKDFVNYKKREQLRHIVPEEKLGEILGIGVVSFLGLKGEGGEAYSGVAGGLNEIGHWGDINGCEANNWANQTASHNSKIFQECKTKFEAALAKDVLWREVTKFFKESKVNVNDFSYNTPSAIPSMSGLGAETGRSLANAVEEHCSKDLQKGGFGYNDGNNCVKALYSSMYVTSFFDDKTADAKKDTMFPKKEKKGKMKPVTYDWADGLKKDREGASAILRKQHAKENPKLRGQGKMAAFIEASSSLHKIPLQWHSHSYTEGVLKFQENTMED